MSSISDQHKIHRRSQEHPMEHSINGGLYERQHPYHDDICVSSSPNSVNFPCGVTPASVEAAVRAAPSPILPHKTRGRAPSKMSWVTKPDYGPNRSPRSPFKGGLAPFSALKSVPTNEAKYQEWRKSHLPKKNQRLNSSTTIPGLNSQVSFNKSINGKGIKLNNIYIEGYVLIFFFQLLKVTLPPIQYASDKL